MSQKTKSRQVRIADSLIRDLESLARKNPLKPSLAQMANLAIKEGVRVMQEPYNTYEKKNA